MNKLKGGDPMGRELSLFILSSRGNHLASRFYSNFSNRRVLFFLGALFHRIEKGYWKNSCLVKRFIQLSVEVIKVNGGGRQTRH